jgi:hypothetical protein
VRWRINQCHYNRVLLYLHRGDVLNNAFRVSLKIHNEATLALSTILNSAVRRFVTAQNHVFLIIQWLNSKSFSILIRTVSKAHVSLYSDFNFKQGHSLARKGGGIGAAACLQQNESLKWKNLVFCAVKILNYRDSLVIRVPGWSGHFWAKYSVVFPIEIIIIIIIILHCYNIIVGGVFPL